MASPLACSRSCHLSSPFHQNLSRFSLPLPQYRRTIPRRPSSPSPVLSSQRSTTAQPTPKIQQLFSAVSPYNMITVLEIPNDMSSDFAGFRLLFLDGSGNVHSIYKDDCKMTKLYWDHFATLPPIIPDGPIAILGLGGGTSAHLLLDLWPSCKLIGWEIDPVLIDVARTYFGLSKLEVPNSEGGVLEVQIEDAFKLPPSSDGSFAGIIVDLFADGEILPQLQQPETWFTLKKKLQDGGRIMVNCGGACVEKNDPMSELGKGTWTWQDGDFAKDRTLLAMKQAFPQMAYRILESGNYLALTGSLPDLKTWAAALPHELQKGLTHWRTCS